MLDNFGLLIKTLRTSVGLTQKEFADKLGTTHSAVSKWERGQNYPDVALLSQIASQLNITCDELLNPTETLQKLNNQSAIPVIEMKETVEAPVIVTIEEKRVQRKQTFTPKLLFLLIVPAALVTALFIFKLTTSYTLTDGNEQFKYIQSRNNVETPYGPAYELIFYQENTYSHETYTKYADELAKEWRAGAYKDSVENVFIVSYYTSGENIDNWHDVYCRCFYLNNPPE